MPSESDYPVGRGGMFAVKFVRTLAKTVAAADVGPSGFCLLSIIATTEDAAHYRRPVTYFDTQLCDILACDPKTLRRAREACVSAGWLHWQRGGRYQPSRYWVLVPVTAQGLDDRPSDEGGTWDDTSNEAPSPDKFSQGKNPIEKQPHRENLPFASPTKGKNSRSRPSLLPVPITRPEPHVHEHEVLTKRSQKKPTTPASLLDVTDAELRDTPALLQRIDRLVADGALPDTEGDRLHAVAAACRAIDVGTNAPGLWVTLVRKRDWSKLSADDEDAATARLRAHRRESASSNPLVAALADKLAASSPPLPEGGDA